MRSPLRPGAESRGSAAALVAAGVLLGLLGMHALGLHGVQHDAAPAMPVYGLSHAGNAAPVAARHDHLATPDRPEAVAGCCDDDHGMGAALLCVALIVVAGILIGAQRSTRIADLRVRLRQGTTWPPSGPAARAGPPYLLSFSVIRC